MAVDIARLNAKQLTLCFSAMAVGVAVLVFQATQKPDLSQAPSSLGIEVADPTAECARMRAHNQHSGTAPKGGTFYNRATGKRCTVYAL